ncbi:MAG: UDP-4-amino-4,6-dideoxy-N-acetyl-beta-L-altrosamine transaminase [Candidatus Melainabacteria bacterium]|nr:UDP-4-amino-4,6-dideoxy-N-acetyl-beta-L-altrosamine transaminase [Candidatus Melainabacteria bacterium]
MSSALSCPTDAAASSWIPYGRQHITPEDVQAVTAVLQSDWLTQGPAVEQFEKAVAEYCGARFAVAVSSATAGLHLACMALDLTEEDWLWTTPNTFVASANCGRYCGAQVDFVDIDPRTYTMDANLLAAKLAWAATQGRLPKVVVPVDFAGQPADWESLHALSHQYGFHLIEDAAHAIGAQYHGKPVGCGQWAEMTVFSFHPVKIMTTGEGGMVLTNRRDLYERLLRLRTHGITRDTLRMYEDPDGPWYYEQLSLGYNYRMTDIQAALGCSQLQRLDALVQRRGELAQRYNQALASLPLTGPWQRPESQSQSAWHLYVVRLHLETIGIAKRVLVERLKAAGIGTQVHYIPVHTHPYYRQFGFNWGDFPESERYYREALSLPLYVGLSDAQQDFVIETLRACLQPTQLKAAPES